MEEKRCPVCGEKLQTYPDYYYCFRCSKQFKKRFLSGKLKEVRNTLSSDQRRAMKR